MPDFEIKWVESEEWDEAFDKIESAFNEACQTIGYDAAINILMNAVVRFGCQRSPTNTLMALTSASRVVATYYPMEPGRDH